MKFSARRALVVRGDRVRSVTSILALGNRHVKTPKKRRRGRRILLNLNGPLGALLVRPTD